MGRVAADNQLLIALDRIDEVIETIRSSPDVPTAQTQLMARFGLSEIQADAILRMQLQRLTGLEREKLDGGVPADRLELPRPAAQHRALEAVRVVGAADRGLQTAG